MNKNAEPIGNGFTTILSTLREGHTLDELSAALLDVTQRVRQTGKSGTLTLQIKVTPMSRGAGNSIGITDKITTKLPEFERETSIFFADDDYRLHREDPRQAKLDLKELPKAAPIELKTAELKTAVNL